MVSTRNRLNQRRVTVRSEALDASVAGTFNTSDVVRDVQTLITEYRLNFESNAAATADYYRRKRQRALPVYQVDLLLNLKTAQPGADSCLCPSCGWPTAAASTARSGTAKPRFSSSAATSTACATARCRR